MKSTWSQHIITVLIVIGIAILLVKFTKHAPTVQPNSVIALSSVLVADTDPLRELGLGDRDSISSDTGMFFTFDHPDIYSFWMKDMRFPIDIIWLDDSFRVIHVENSVSPESYPKIFSPTEKSSFVLEVAAGIAKKNNYTEGSTLDFL